MPASPVARHLITVSLFEVAAHVFRGQTEIEVQQHIIEKSVDVFGAGVPDRLLGKIAKFARL